MESLVVLQYEYHVAGAAAASVGGSTRVDVLSQRKGPWWSCVAAGRQSRLLLSHRYRG